MLGSLEKFDESKGCCDKALKINPKSAEIWLNKGAALLRLARLESEKGSKNISGSFVKYFKLGLRLDPKIIDNRPTKEIIKKRKSDNNHINNV